MPKLSLCIPTYNFGSFIEESLVSILEQEGADTIEVVVVDGASTDQTEDVMKRLCRIYSQIKYHRLPHKGGIDRDMAKSVELSQGEYCWIFSSDDIMRKGALRDVLLNLKEGHDLYLCKHRECTYDLQPQFIYPVLTIKYDALFNLGDRRDRIKYFGLASNTEAFFAFLGGIIIKRTVWDTVPFNEDFSTSCWGLAARLFQIIKERGLTLKYLSRALLDRRGGNDSFMKSGIVKRFHLTIDGFNKLADTFFGHESREAYLIRKALRREYPCRAFLFAQYCCLSNPQEEDGALLKTLLLKTYSDPTLDRFLTLNLVRLFPSSLSLYKILRWIGVKLKSAFYTLNRFTQRSY